MWYKSIWISSLLLLFIAIGCHSDVDMLNQIDLNSPFILCRNLRSNDLNEFMNLDSIQINSKKGELLLKFAKENTSDWKSTPVSYIADYSLLSDKRSGFLKKPN
jgi:hypothetical protein